MATPLHVVEDLLAFVEVVECRGFTPASQRSGVPKSRLSRCVAALEHSLGVRLLRRDAGVFELTDLGARIFAHGLAVRAETQGAVALAADSLAEPSGRLRVACPSALAHGFVGRIATEFGRRHPQVVLVLQTTNGSPGAAADGADITLQPAGAPLADAGVVARSLGDMPYLLVASPGLAATLGDPQTPEALAGLAGIGWSFTPHLSRWRLHGPQGREAEVEMDIRFASDSLMLNRDAALQGLGIAQLSRRVCVPHLADGTLVVVAPAWRPPTLAIHALYPSRQHLTLAGRRFLELMAAAMADDAALAEQAVPFAERTVAGRACDAD